MSVETLSLAARACSEDERPAHLGKRASRSFLALRSTSETLVVRDNRDGCLPFRSARPQRWRRRALTPLNRQMERKMACGQAVSRISLPALARSEDERPAHLGKRASRSFLPLRSTSETLVVRDNRDGCLPIETPSLPTLARSYPRHFTFYVALPTRSILVTRHTPLVTLLSIAFHSSGLSWSFAAAMFSSRCASDDVPGIGNMTGDFCNNHASASCTTLTLRRFASTSNALLALLNERLPPPPIGAHGMNPIFSFAQYLSASSESRSVMLYRFWMLTIGMTFFARSISATVTSDNPTCRIFPASCAALRAPTDPSTGTLGSMRCN